MNIMLSKFPGLLSAMKKRHLMYNEETKYVFEKAGRGEIVVICPKQDLGISRTEKNPDELERCYKEGRCAALEKLEEIKKYLSA